MHCIASRFALIVAVAVLAAAKVAAQQAPSAAGPHLQPNAGGEAAAVKQSRRHHAAVLGPGTT